MKIFLLILTLAVFVAITVAAYRVWLEGTHGERGPAAVATTLTMIVIAAVLFAGIKSQESPPPPPPQTEE
jgi:integral membrane sensor domain MASE1